MKLIKFALCFFGFVVFAHNPFSKTPKTKLFLQQKYQYLGYIRGPDIYYGFVRHSGAGIERLAFGKNPGFGEITLISQEKICLTKTKQQWCLYKSTQAHPWILTS